MSLALTAIGPSASVSISQALSTASAATGTDFEYLLATAKRESSLNPQAKSKSSSATGLFQFIDQTWLATVKKHGAKHGLKAAADAIAARPGGRYEVADPARRAEILALRKDPTASALMAGELTKESSDILTQALGRVPDDGELYMAHFLGAAGAAKFLQAAKASPDAPAAEAFSRAASANRSVFYDQAGRARSFSDVKAHLARLHTQTGPSSPPQLPVPETGTQPVQLAEAGHGQIGLAGSGGFGGAVQPLRLTPDVLKILSSLDAVPGKSRDKDGSYEKALSTALS